MSKLNKRAWSNRKLTEHTKIQIYKACVLSTLLYGSESWTLHAYHEKRLAVFHMRQLRRILGITWEDRISNNTVLERADIPSMYTLLKQRRMRWLGHTVRMEDGRIPKDLLYGELTEGSRPSGRPHLRYKDVCKRDLLALGININTWETTAAHRALWRYAVTDGLVDFENQLRRNSDLKRAQRKLRSQSDRPATGFTCAHCGKDCHSTIGLYSHHRRCTPTCP